MTRILSGELLEQLADRWRAQGAAIANGQLRPGLSDAEMDRLTEPLGLRLPPEARAWWGWHDGAIPSTRAGEITVGGWTFAPLAAAVARTVDERSWYAPDQLPDQQWRRPRPRGAAWATGLFHWVPDIGGNQLAIDCRDPGPASPVYYLDKVERDETGPRAESIGEAVQQMIDAIDCGAVSFNHANNLWALEESLLPQHLRRMSII